MFLQKKFQMQKTVTLKNCNEPNVDNAIDFVDKNVYVLLIFFFKNPSIIGMFLRWRGGLFDIVWTDLFPETFS